MDTRLAYMQRTLARTSATTLLTRTGQHIARPPLLADPGDPAWSGLREVGIRVGRFGRVLYDHDGEEHAIQFMPVSMQTLEAPAEHLIAQMDYVGIDHTVLQCGGIYGAMTEGNLAAAAAYPDRLTAQVHIPESTADTEEALATIEDSAARGAKGLFFAYDGFARTGYRLRINSPELAPFWSLVAERNLVVCFDINSAPGYTAADYISAIADLDEVMTRVPTLKCHLSMGIPVGYFSAGDRWNIPDELLSFYRRDRVWIEFMFPITWGGTWDYPFPETHGLVADGIRLFGAEKFLWGSDMPNVERFCTYAQSLNYLRRHCKFISPAQLDLILGANTAALYDIPARVLPAGETSAQ